jgi:hypothetical protein
MRGGPSRRSGRHLQASFRTPRCPCPPDCQQRFRPCALPYSTPFLLKVKNLCFAPMKRAILVGALAAAGVAVFACPSQAATDAPCQPTKALEAPCKQTPPCLPSEAPCHS